MLTGVERQNILKQMGIVFQSYTLLHQKTALENVLLPFELQGPVTDKHKAKALKLLFEVGLAEKASAYPSELSGGQKQRVAIARALALEPGILLCDELTSALDPETTYEILLLLKKLNKTHGVTIVIVTHDMNVVQEVAHIVYVMDQGAVVEHGLTKDILIRPQHPVTRQLIESRQNCNLPLFIQERIVYTADNDLDIVLKLIFTPETSRQPFIALLTEKFAVRLSIIGGSLDHVGDETFGHLWVTCPYRNYHSEVIDYFDQHGIIAEPMGYIKWT
jgi:D-methionine transport system ATP-binding protein